MVSSFEGTLSVLKGGYREGVRVMRLGRGEKKQKLGVGKRNGARRVHVVEYRTTRPDNRLPESDKWRSGGVYMSE
jgi:hypothetical protein